MKPIEMTDKQRRILEAMERGDEIRLMTADEAMVANKTHARAVAKAWRRLIGDEG